MNKDELQQLAQQKEQEWKAINEKRIEALEEELKRNVKLVDQEKKNFSQLKEDFKYNLKLLEDRDKELSSIESHYTALKRQQSDKDALISELKIEIDEFKKVLEKEKKNQDEGKRFYLERLQEKQNEFENYKMTKDNEIKNERNEIENHKRSLQNHVESLKYDLERQRQEMKNEFDEVLRKREHEWRKSFDEQCTETLAKELQVKLLNNELELVRENNKRFQLEFDDMESKYKKLERGMKEKDWQLKDNVSLKDAKINDLEAKLKELEGGSRRQLDDFKNKIEKMDKTIREKDLQMKTLKENRIDIDRERMQFEEKLKEHKVEIEEKERCMEKFIEEKGQIILNLTEELLRLKTSNDEIQKKSSSTNLFETTVVSNQKQSFTEIKAENNDLKAEKMLHIKYLTDYKTKLEKCLEREQVLEQEKAQLDLDWQKKYEELENIKFTTSEDYLKKLSDSRNQALAQVSSLEERLKQKEALINALKSSNPTLDALNTEVYESKYKEENEYLKQIVKQMREEIETLAHDLPQRDYNSVNSTRNFKNSTENENNLKMTQKPRNFELTEISDNKTNTMISSDNTIINDHVETLHKKISLLRKEKMELTSYLKKQQIRVLHFEKSISNSTEQLNSKQTQIETLQYEFNSQARRHTNEINSLKQRIGELELELNESNKEADEYHKNFIQKESEIAGLELKISDLKLKLSSNGTQINFGGQELFIQQLQDEIQRLNEKLINRSDNSGKVDGVTINEIEYMKEIKSLKGKLKGLAKHLSQLIHEKQQLIEMSNQLRAELDKTRRQYEDSKFKRFNSAKENFSDIVPSVIDYSSKLKKLEDIQYNLTKKDLAFANIKNTNSNPNLRPKSSDETRVSSFSSDNDNKTVSSVRSENLQDLWKILDDTNNSQIITQRDETKMIKERQKSINNKNEYVIDQQLSARGEKKPIFNGRTTTVATKEVIKKPKIRNYNIKNDD